MPGRKQEAELSRKRLRRRIATTIDSPVFRDHVRDLREVLHIDKANRDVWYAKVVEHKKGLTAEKPVELPSGWQPFESETLQSGIGEEVLWNRARAIDMVRSHLSLAERFTLSLGQLMLAQKGLEVSEDFLLGALCHDFEGEERDAFIDFIVPVEKAVRVHYWYEPMAPYVPYSDWVKQNTMQPNRIYLDVTHASLSDVQECWPDVSELQNRLEVARPKVGQPLGIQPRRVEVVRGMTWAETREYLRSNPGELAQLENRYVDRSAARRKDKKEKSGQICTGQDIAAWRGKAIRNFYKQVILHPEMRDLNLSLRRRGRPRKGK